jgi:PEGA domain-containing protein
MLKFINGWIRARRGTPTPVVEDALDAFGSEAHPDAFGSEFRRTPAVSGSRVPASVRFADALRPKWLQAKWRVPLVLAAVVVVGASAYLLRNWRALNVEAASATLTIESMPGGAEVFAGGVSQGRTPLTMSVAPGEHTFELLLDGRRKPLVAVARAGAAVVHHIEFDVGPEAPKSASLTIKTDPARLRVLVDGVARGVSPLTINDVKAGTHEVQVVGTSGTLKRKVEIAAGESASVIISTPARGSTSPSSPAAGWLSVSSPVTLQVIEGKEIVGTTASAKMMLPAGKHDLLLSNDVLGFAERRTIHVGAGSTSKLTVDLPDAPLSINAVPWAEVWIDGVRVGETPIGNRAVRIGVHEVVFRHPEFGERRQNVTVTLTSRARVSVDMRKSGS